MPDPQPNDPALPDRPRPDASESVGRGGPAPPGDQAALAELQRAWTALARGGTADGPAAQGAELAAFEERLFALEEGVAFPGGDPAAHARAVAGAWRERLIRSGRSGAARRLSVALRNSEAEWLAARRRAASRSPRDAFVALMEVEECSLRWLGGGVPGEGAEVDELEAQAADARAELRRALARQMAEEAVDGELRGVMTGRMVDLADDTILMTGESTASECAQALALVADAFAWHLQQIEVAPGQDRSRLVRRVGRVERELVEQRLQVRLEERFGAGKVALWERAVVGSILVVLGLLAVEVLQVLGLIRVPELPLKIIDTSICAFLLVDFSVKLGFVSRRRLWLRRHLWTDLLPAVPFGLFAPSDGLAGGAGQASRMLRLLRLARLGAYLRALRPLIWLVRAVGFLLRGLDRVVRRHARALEREVIVFPTPAEQREPWRSAADQRRGVVALRRAVDTAFMERHEGADPGGRAALEGSRAAVLERALGRSGSLEPQDRGRPRGQLPLAETLLRRLSSVTGEELEESLGESTVSRLGRAARLVSRSPLRWAPGLGSWSAPDALGAPAAEHVARCLHRIAEGLHRALGRVFWWADLHGTLTPGEVVGRIGAALVARTARPAVRLLLFGVPFLGLQLAFAALDSAGDAELRSFAVIRLINGVVGQTFAVLGGVCLVLLAIGAWLQRIARDTTTFHEKVARAQFLHLTDSLKARSHADDAGFLCDRVFAPERRLAGADSTVAEADGERFHATLHGFLRRGEPVVSEGGSFDPVARTVLLYRDQLDGALLAHTDTRATSQLLGNLAINRLSQASGRVSAQRLRWMQSLDLERRRTLVRGPYLWFHAISRSLESRAARLIVEYNANAIPRADWSRASEVERAGHRRWLEGGAAPVPRGQAGERRADRGVRPAQATKSELTTAFTALHFLDDHARRDEEVTRRFGEEVAVKMRADRRALVRSVFGTYPLHLLPLESRVLNLRSLYEEWLQGGRVLLLPLRTIAFGARMLVRGARRLVRAVGAIRNPGVALEAGPEHEAGFDVAARKIQRMRGPAAIAALELRAILDPEYHGWCLTGAVDLACAEVHGGGAAGEWGASWAALDAEYLGASPATVRRVASLQRRAGRGIVRLNRALEDGLGARLAALLGTDPRSDPEAFRALHVVVHGDLHGVRSALFGEAILVESIVDGALHGVRRAAARPRLRLRLSFLRWWRSGGAQRVLRAALEAGAVDRRDKVAGDTGDPRWRRRQARRRLRRSAWRVVASDADGARACLRSALSRGEPARAAASEQRLADALRHPSRVTEQLVTLRATQSLTLLDLRSYRRQVWRLGRYGEEGDPEPPARPGLG